MNMLMMYMAGAFLSMPLFFIVLRIVEQILSIKGTWYIRTNVMFTLIAWSLCVLIWPVTALSIVFLLIYYAILIVKKRGNDSHKDGKENYGH